MSTKVNPIPPGYHTITAHLSVNGAGKAIDFYKKAFGAEELMRVPGPGGKLMHAEVKIGDSILYLADEFPEMGGDCATRSPKALGGVSSVLHLYVADVDASFARAVSAGATAKMPLMDMFWGDRYGQLEDPFGHRWSMASHKEDLTPAQIAERQKQFMASMAQKKG